MEELVGSDIVERLGIIFHVLGVQFDGCGIRVLHPSATWPAWEVIKEQILLKWTIVNPGSRRRDDALRIHSEPRHVVVRSVRVDDDAIVSPTLVKIRFLKGADF